MNDNLKGAVLMMISMAGFVVNDTIIKLIGQAMPLGQLLLVRGLIASALIAFLVFLFRQTFRIPRAIWPWFSFRLVGELVTTFGFLTALMNMPLANATALLQITPLVLTLAAIFVFNEVVGWRRWIAILVGFVGVLLIVRPGYEGFNIYSLMVLAAVIGSTIRDIATRKLPAHIHNLTITAYTSVAVTVAGGLLMLASGQAIDLNGSIVLGLGGSAVFLLLGYFGISAAMRQGDLAIVTPFRYTVFPWAIILGFIAFGDLPDWLTIVGAGLIIGSGIVTISRTIRGTGQQQLAGQPSPSGFKQ